MYLILFKHNTCDQGGFVETWFSLLLSELFDSTGETESFDCESITLWQLSIGCSSRLSTFSSIGATLIIREILGIGSTFLFIGATLIIREILGIGSTFWFIDAMLMIREILGIGCNSIASPGWLVGWGFCGVFCLVNSYTPIYYNCCSSWKGTDQ